MSQGSYHLELRGLLEAATSLGSCLLGFPSWATSASSRGPSFFVLPAPRAVRGSGTCHHALCLGLSSNGSGHHVSGLSLKQSLDTPSTAKGRSPSQSSFLHLRVTVAEMDEVTQLDPHSSSGFFLPDWVACVRVEHQSQVSRGARTSGECRTTRGERQSPQTWSFPFFSERTTL